MEKNVVRQIAKDSMFGITLAAQQCGSWVLKTLSLNTVPLWLGM